MTKKNKKRVNLALQGGGAHGAFTWGILDKFLELDLFTIEGISATSAGSMNAVVLAQGMMEGGNEGARDLLHQFWHKMSDYGQWMDLMTKTPMDYLLQPYLPVSLNFYFFSALMNAFSPYEFNPFNFHPIREVLKGIVDIDKIKKQSMIKLFICATNVKTGKIRIFKEAELSIDSILASACLPKLFQAVEVEGEYYWDGGYLGNPAIFPLIYNTDVKDIIVLHVVPIVRENVPKTNMEIDLRLREISFNSSLMREMRAIAFVTKLIDEKWMKPEYQDRLKRLNMHCLRADHALQSYPLESVFMPNREFLLHLRDLGRQAAEVWLKENYHAIGKKTSANFDEWL
jgi:NTE family protein